MRKYTIPQPMTVEYLLGDQLGSTSLTTDSTGAMVSQIKYKPWGETRSTWTNPNLNTTPAYALTNYTYTGQYSYTNSFGLMYYNARWYDPSLGRFNQPDSVVPSGVQGMDRYAYGLNNPVKYTDPSGFTPCSGDNWDDGPQCTKTTQFWDKAISIQFDWKVASDFSMKELKTIYQAGVTIETYVDHLTGGKGSEWMDKYLGGTTFVHGTVSFFGNPYTTGNTVHMYENMSAYWITHELGHIYDNNAARLDYGSRVEAIWDGGGPADKMYEELVGTSPTGWRWGNGLGFSFPDNLKFPMEDNKGYGNNSTADYFAETFAGSIYHLPVPLSDPNVVGYGPSRVLEEFITSEGYNLP
jgi:RHS repeat-associated protein